MAICPYCNEEKLLCESHAMPDGFFKLISKKNNGQLINISTDEGHIHRSQNTGKSKLLCKECEGDFNRRFDGPLVNAFKAWDKKITRQGFDARYEFSPDKIAQALISIFWRASESQNEMYINSKVAINEKKQLLSIIKNDQTFVLENCSCSIHRIYDKTSEENGGFSQEVISQIILPVNAYHIKWGKSQASKGFGFSVLLQGFLCHLIIPKLPKTKSNKPGFLKTGNRKLHAPPYYLLNYEPLKGVLLTGYSKHIHGKSKLKK